MKKIRQLDGVQAIKMALLFITVAQLTSLFDCILDLFDCILVLVLSWNRRQGKKKAEKIESCSFLGHCNQ